MKFWNWLDGKKTIIAAFYNAVTWPSVMIFFDNSPPDMVVKVNMIIGLILMFIGVGHKMIKPSNPVVKKDNTVG